MEFRKIVVITLYAKQKKRHRCTEQTFGLCGRRRGWDVSKEQHVYYLGWNRSPAQVGCMRQVLGPGALGRPRGIGWRGRWEGGSGWGIHVTPWLIHVNVWQNPLKCCEVISLQLIKKKKRCLRWHNQLRGRGSWVSEAQGSGFRGSAHETQVDFSNLSWSWCSRLFSKNDGGASLVTQWLRIHLPMQGTQVWSLVQKDPTQGNYAHVPQLLNTGATTVESTFPRACAPQ